MSKVSKTLGALLALAFAGAVGATPLSDLFAGASLTVGDKVFDRWALQGQGLIDSTGLVELAKIDVTGSVDGSNVVLRFDAGDELSLTGDHLIDLYFGYRVSVLPASSMSLASVAFNFMQGSFGGDGFHAATEDIFDAAGNALGRIDLEASNVLFQTGGSAAFSPVRELFVQKNILLNGFAAGDSTRLDWFTQTFSQVPEPATPWLVVLAAGLAGSVARRRPGLSLSR